MKHGPILPALIGAFGLVFAACGDSGSNSGSKSGDSGEQTGDSKTNEQTPYEAKAPEFKKYGEGEAPVAITELGVEFDNDVMDRSKKTLDSSFKIKLIKAISKDSSMRIKVKSTCKIGDELIMDTSSPFIQLEKLEPGETKQAEASNYAMRGLESASDTCEISFFVGELMSDDPPYHLQDHCFSGGKVSDGKCPGFERPKADARLKITKASAEIVPIDYGEEAGRKKLSVDYTVLVGSAIDHDMMFVKAACQVGDEKIVDETASMGSFGFTLPGESMLLWASTYTEKGLTSDPSQCDLTFSLKGLFDDDGGELAKYCFKDGKLNEGKCS